MNPPTTNELKIMISNLETKLDEHAEVHKDIIKLIEDMRQEMRESNGWRNKFIGALGVVIVIVVPLLAWALTEVSQIDEKINDALADYEIKIIE